MPFDIDNQELQKGLKSNTPPLSRNMNLKNTSSQEKSTVEK